MKKVSLLQKFFPKQKAPRKSIYSGITLDDFITNSFYGSDIIMFFDGVTRPLEPNRIYKSQETEWRDEFLLLLEELDLIHIDWKAWSDIQEVKHHLMLDKRDIPFHYSSNDIRDLVDKIWEVENTRNRFKTLKEEREYLEKRAWETDELPKINPPLPKTTKWEEVEIRFLNHHEIQIKARDIILTTTAEAMGWTLRKSKFAMPNKNWELIYKVAEQAHTAGIPNAQSIPVNFERLSRERIRLCRAALKYYFRINDDPLEFGKQGKRFFRFTLIPEADITAEDLSETKSYLNETSPVVVDKHEL